MSLSQEHNSLKRDHDSFDFDSLVDLEKPFIVPTEISQTYSQLEDPERDSGESSMPTPPVSIGTNKMDVSPGRSRSASLTEAGSDTPSRGSTPMAASDFMSFAQQASPSPSIFAGLNGSAPPPAKKAKLSYAEKEAKRIAKDIKDQEQAEEKAIKQREREAQVAEKAKRDAEKDAEKRKREAEREQKRAVQEVEKAAKEEKKRRKEEEKLEKQRVEEEKKKKDGKQKPLTSFFQTSAAQKPNPLAERRSESPVSTSNEPAIVASTSTSAPRKPERTAYEKAFSDFFLFPDVTVAPNNRFERDEEASKSLHCAIDSYILGDRSPGHPRQFDAFDLFRLSAHDNMPRGKHCMPVREIMAEMFGKSTRPIDLTTDSQNTQIKRTHDLLRKIPLKLLKFQEDVRPPYKGTYTSRPVNGMVKLARNPWRRDLPDTNYDYDSEAEWAEDEDAEDLHSEGEEDEDMGDDAEDMDGFLDDENDEIANSKRLVLQGDLEPISTGLCWEDHHKRTTNVKLMPYRMENILSKCSKGSGFSLNEEMPTNTGRAMKSIDPFSSQYWEPTIVAHTTMDPPRVPLNTLKASSLTVNGSSNPAKPVKPFFTSASDLLKLNPSPGQLSTHLTPIPPHSTALPSSSNTGLTAPAATAKPKKLVPAEDMHDFKREIEGSNLSKVGLIEVLKKKFPGRSGAAIKSTLELIAKRAGTKEVDKRWVIVDESNAA